MTSKEAWAWLGNYKFGGGDWNRMPIAEIEVILDSFVATEKRVEKVKADRAALVAACEAYKGLLACYRLGKNPSEKLFDQLEKADAALAGAKEETP